jgi:hypothetical protein
MVEWWNGWSYNHISWNVYAGQDQTWYDLPIQCSYQTGGAKTVNFTANGAHNSVSFSLQALTFGFNYGYPSPGSYSPPINDPVNGYINPGTPAPTNVDIAIGMRQQLGQRYQDDGSYQGYDGRPFTYIVDCFNTSVFNGPVRSSSPTNLRIFPGNAPTWTSATDAQNICHFDNPGNYPVNIQITDPAGTKTVITENYFIRNAAPFALSLYPSGQTPGQSAYIARLNQPVALDVNISGLTPSNSGSYNTSIDCGNGQTVGGPSANGRNYSADGTLLARNIGPCTYAATGVYTVKATFQENKPASDPSPAMSGTGTTKIVVTSQSDVASPFYLNWDVSGAASCSITGPDNYSGLSASGSEHNISHPIGTYKYNLTCDSSSGGAPIQSEIDVNVIYVMNP